MFGVIKYTKKRERVRVGCGWERVRVENVTYYFTENHYKIHYSVMKKSYHIYKWRNVYKFQGL